MVLIKKGTIAAAFVVASMSFSHAAFAQQATTPQTETQEQASAEEFSEDVLEKFVEANSTVTEIQKASRDSLISAIESENLTVDRFNELAKAHQAQKLEEVAEGTEEISAFSSAAQRVVKMQPETKERVEEAIQEEGLTVEQYEKIMAAYQSDPVVKAKISAVINKD
ncbi:DUF4168 domain-containing protein [Pontibacter pamirensis]|uniref:DUF4168 domain-containing protein n=1 Tax=Pontibacter pamirensis TaxID=2562824 RepID=UPI00138A181D|nr:DUF4168 domain-containing protein [Pontibacter pamirensis]